MSVTPVRPFGAVVVAMVTPFSPDGSLDLDSAASLAAHLVDQGCDGLVISGTTGESPTTTDEEKDWLLRAVVDAVGGRAHVLAGVGTPSTEHTLHLTAAAHKAGATGLLVVTPYYSKPSPQGLLQHFEAISQSSELPIMLYDIPGRCSLSIDDDTLAAVATFGNVVALKDATNDIFEAGLRAQSTGLAWYSGVDELNFHHLAQGAAGVVSVAGHIYSRQLANLVEAIDANNLSRARAIHQELVPGLIGTMRQVPGAVAAKHLLYRTGVLASQTTRLPYVPPNPAQAQRIAQFVEQTGITLLKDSE